MPYIPAMTSTDYISQEKKRESDMPVLKIALIHRHNDSNTIFKKLRGRLVTITRNNVEYTCINRTKITRKQKWEEK